MAAREGKDIGVAVGRYCYPRPRPNQTTRSRVLARSCRSPLTDSSRRSATRSRRGRVAARGSGAVHAADEPDVCAQETSSARFLTPRLLCTRSTCLRTVAGADHERGRDLGDVGAADGDEAHDLLLPGGERGGGAGRLIVLARRAQPSHLRGDSGEQLAGVDRSSSCSRPRRLRVRRCGRTVLSAIPRGR